MTPPSSSRGRRTDGRTESWQDAAPAPAAARAAGAPPDRRAPTAPDARGRRGSGGEEGARLGPGFLALLQLRWAGQLLLLASASSPFLPPPLSLPSSSPRLLRLLPTSREPPLRCPLRPPRSGAGSPRGTHPGEMVPGPRRRRALLLGAAYLPKRRSPAETERGSPGALCWLQWRRGRPRAEGQGMGGYRFMQVLQTRLHGKRVFLELFRSLSLFSPPCDMLSFHRCY